MKGQHTLGLGKRDNLKSFCAGLKKYDHYALACHMTPEGDAIGSLLAMESLLRRLGKKTTVLSQDPFPKRLLACLSDKKWKRLHETEKKIPHYEALLLTDCPTLQRIGNVARLVRPETAIFNIDHHVSNELFGDYNFVRPKAAATGEVVYDVFHAFKLPFTKEEAAQLYVALSTDTGSFKYSNTSAHSHRIAADLISTGINIEKINDALYGTSSLNRINLYSRLLSRVKTASHGAIAWAGLRLKDLKHSGTTYEDTEGFIDFLRYMKEVRIAFFMSEFHRPDRIKVSFRSKGSLDVNKIATSFAGGGHLKAAGCIIHGTLEEAEKMILERLEKEL